MILSDYELACLYSANGDKSKLAGLDLDAGEKLVKMGLATIDAVDADTKKLVTTDAGKRFLETNANNRGIV